MSEQRKLLSNSLSMLVNRLVQGVSTFVLTAAIARSLGSEALGQYLLAISYYYVFVNIASQGLKALFTREIARDPESTPIYLVNGTLLQLILSIISYVALVTWIFLLPYKPETSLICYLIGLTIIPFALSNITEAIFQAQEKMHLIALSTTPVYILRLLVMIWIMQLHYGIPYLAIILVFSETLILIIEWILLTNEIKPKWEIDKYFICKNIKNARTFFAIEGIYIISAKMDIVLLSLLGTETLIGIYGAISQMLQPFSMISNSVTLAGFPGMSKAKILGKANQIKVTEQILEILLCIALPFFLGLIFMGRDLLLFIYKDPAFSQAGIILNIISLAVVLSSFNRTFSYLLVANDFEKFNLIAVCVTTLLGGLSGVLLISQYKLIGAACMGMIMTFSYFSIMIYAVYTRLFSLNLWRLFRLPILISSFMLIIFILLQKMKLEFLISLGLATCAYCGFASLIVIKIVGWQNMWQKIVKKT